MAKNPVFPLYYNDFLGSTITWTDEEVGAYIRLLIYQWDSKELPKDYQRLTRIATSMDANWTTIKNKFTETETGYINTNLEVIRTKQLIFKEKQKNNVLKRYQNSTKPSTKNLPLEIENEIEIENEEVIELEKESLREKTENPNLETLKIYFESLRANPIEAEKFYSFYESNGWMVGKNKMKNWKAAVNSWVLNNQSKNIEFKKPDLRINSGVVDRGTEIANQMRLERELAKVKV